MTLRPWALPLIVGLLAVPMTGSFASWNPSLEGGSPESLGASPVTVTHIYFDHSGSEAIHLRKNYSTTIPKPEWVMDERSGAALFIQNSPVVILARFEAPTTVDSAYIWTQATGPLGKVKGQWVRFSGGVSDPEYYSFSTQYSTPAGLDRSTWSWQWKAGILPDSTIGLMNISGPHKIYTILDEPGLPWEIVSENNQNPWTIALDLVIRRIKATTVEQVLDKVTQACFDRPCFEYDIWSGRPCYITGVWDFNLSLFIDDMRTGHDPRIGCCYDGAAIVHTFADLLGAHTHFVLSGTPYTSNPFGYLNCIDPIGRGEDYANNPFHENSYYRDDPIVYQDGTASSCGRSAFGNHAFAATQTGTAGVIWDGTMCADVDDNEDTSVKFPPDGGYTSDALTQTTLTDNDQNWTPNQWAGMYLNPNTNETSPDPYKEYLIMGNTATVITVEAGSNMTQYANAGDYYWIRDPNDPDVEIVYLTGYPWSEYDEIAVDAPYWFGGRADPPVERFVSLY